VTDEAPSRGEFELLRQMVTQNHAWLENMDNHGTRGIGALQQQVGDVKNDITEIKLGQAALRNDVDEKFERHSKQHETAERSRTIGKRYVVTTALAFGLLLCAMAAAIIDILSKLKT
jgi:hypothetical protein